MPIQIQFVATKVDGQYEPALIVDGKFRRSSHGDSVPKLFNVLAGPFLAFDQEDGAEIAVNIGILSARDVVHAEAAAALPKEKR